MVNTTFEGFDENATPEGAQPPVASAVSEPIGAATAPVPMPISTRETLDFQLKSSGQNKLLEAAMPLLGLCVRIRNMGQYESVNSLHSRVINEVTTFQREIESHKYDSATVLAARYALCAMIDESVLAQQWGAESLWPERPLLSLFHNETWGGEKFFSILDRVMNEPNRFIDLLEFLYFCMALGFEGKYHVMHNGQQKRDFLLQAVYKLLEQFRGEPPSGLLDPTANIYERKQKLPRRVPRWLIVLASLLVVVGIHLYFDQKLDTRMAEIGNQIETALSVTVRQEAE